MCFLSHKEDEKGSLVVLKTLKRSSVCTSPGPAGLRSIREALHAKSS